MNMPMFPLATDFLDQGTSTLPIHDYVRMQLEDELICAQSPAASAASLSVTQLRLLELLESSGQDDYGEVSPTQFAFRKTFHLVSDAEAILGPRKPRGSCSVDSEGGIRTTWNLVDTEVRLVCPATPDREVYMYFEADGQSDIIKNPTAAVLAQKLCRTKYHR